MDPKSAEHLMPAFPVTDPFAFSPKTMDEAEQLAHGMALRDYFAAKAMTGMLGGDHEWAHKENYQQLALRSYDIADAMLRARLK